MSADDLIDLPATYVRHLVAPQGLGDLHDPHAAGEVGSVVGGLGVRVTLRYVDGGGTNPTVESVAGRAFGNPAMIPPLSYLAQIVPGASWEDAGAITAEHLLAGLSDDAPASLPASVHRGAAFAQGALQRALGVSTEGPPADITGPGLLVCRCLGVGDRIVRKAIHAGATTPDDIGLASRACTGCRSCRPDLLTLLDEELQPAWPEPPRELPTVARIAWAHGGPLLRALGLPLVDLTMDNGTLRAHLGDPAPHVLTSPLGAAAQLRYVLRETTGADVPVEAASA